MDLWRPGLPRRMATIDLAQNDTPVYTLNLNANTRALFPDGSTATIEFRNTYNQVVGTWLGWVHEGSVVFDTDLDNTFPRGTTWDLVIEDINGLPRQLLWGTVTRSEPTYPDGPPASDEFDASLYRYAFDIPGRVYDPQWLIRNGRPTVWENDSLPNSVGAGSGWADVAMLWYAPLKSDSVRLTYNVVKKNTGNAWFVVCSNYTMTNWAGVRHREVSGSGDTLEIITGTGPVNYSTRASITRSTQDLENFTAEYNPVSNTYSVYLGTDKDPLVSWVDSTNVVSHGEGERYLGLGFQSFGNPGVMCADWLATG